MKIKYLLSCLIILNSSNLYSSNSTEHVLLHMLRDRDEAAKQDVLKLIKAIKRLDHKTDVTLVEYQQTLQSLKLNIQDILDNYGSSLDLANQIIFTQQDLLSEYRQSNSTKACVITGLMSCLATWIIITQYPDIIVKTKSTGWFSWITGLGTKLPTTVIK